MPTPETPAAFLRRLIDEEGGSITVERFMQEALYHPEFGYYARHVQTVGRRGDFSTAATLHPALGQAIARWLGAARGKSSGSWHVIELGGGNGDLAASVLRSLGWWGRRGLRYHIVELSPALRAEQHRKLENRKHVSWHDAVERALAAAEGRAFLFSNEFVDAFPCAQFSRDDAAAQWREVRVRWTPAGPESFAPPGSEGGQRIERHRSCRRWLEGWAPQWREGRMLTIDYGDAWPALYLRRPRGTLRAYWQHQRLEGAEVFARFGRQDLTADVDFSALEQIGAELGWGAAPLRSQAAFLRAHLPPRTLRQPDPALAFLLDEAGAGGAFKALEQWPAGSGGGSADPAV